MIHLVALLVDFARTPDDAGFALSDADLAALTGVASPSASSSAASSPCGGSGGGGGEGVGGGVKAPTPVASSDPASTLQQQQQQSVQLSKQTRFPFLFQQIKDNLNLKATVNIIVALAKWKESLQDQIVQMIFKGNLLMIFKGYLLIIFEGSSKVIFCLPD